MKKKSSNKKKNKDIVTEMQERHHKKFSFKRTIDATYHSIDGIKEAYANEQSLYVIFMGGIIMVIAGFFFHISRMEWLFCFALISNIVVTELLNTSIETVVDLVSPEWHILAKNSKDIASGAVLLSSIFSFAMILLVFLPHIIDFIKGLL